MTIIEEFEQIYGPLAEKSEYKIGETITYIDHGQPNGRNTGIVLYVAQASGTMPLLYIVSPTIGLFPCEVSASEVIED